MRPRGGAGPNVEALEVGVSAPDISEACVLAHAPQTLGPSIRGAGATFDSPWGWALLPLQETYSYVECYRKIISAGQKKDSPVRVLGLCGSGTHWRMGGQQQTSVQEKALLGPQSAPPGEVGPGLLTPTWNHTLALHLGRTLSVEWGH